MSFILKSIKFFRRQHIAVFIATIISTAVLTGALIVGDSVTYTLNQLVDDRLGDIDLALSSGDRFVQASLADDLQKSFGLKTASVLMANGVAINSNSSDRINSINIVGVDNEFWKCSNVVGFKLKRNRVVISANSAQKLNIKVNDHILLRVRKSSFIPVNTPFSSEQDMSKAIRVKITEIADDNQMGRFSLKSDQKAPDNIFISREYLARKLDLKGYANLVLVDMADSNLQSQEINKSLKSILQLQDYGIFIKELPDLKKLEVTSNRIFIDDVISEKSSGIDFSEEKILSYLVNEISTDKRTTPYSFVSASSNYSQDIGDDGIVINQWLADDLRAVCGDTIMLKYFVVGALRTVSVDSASFVVRDVLPTQGDVFHRSLMPKFPGLSDAGNCRDWKAGVPVDFDKIRDKDDDYWNKYRGTPKAFISEKRGAQLWGNRFGTYTSIRFNKSEISKSKLSTQLLSKLKPSDVNLSFQAVRGDGVRAASNSVDFGELFISLSFFVILSGIILLVLIYTLNTESRQQEIGVLAALGFSPRRIIAMRFAESAIVIILGSIVGAFVGILYNNIIIYALNTVWIDVVRTSKLEMCVLPKTLIVGALLGAIIALSSVYIITKKRLRRTINSLVRKNVGVYDKQTRRSKNFKKIITFLSFTITIALVLFSFVNSVDRSAGLLLTAGFFFLVSAILLLSIYFDYVKNITDYPNLSQFRVALKNCAMNKGRSISTVALMSIATFLVIITGANRRTFSDVEANNQSGTGGYNFWMETAMPILNNLNSSEAQQKLGLADEKALEDCEYLQFHLLPGDDASCLNLNKVARPQVLGVNPQKLHERQSFSFSKSVESLAHHDVWAELNSRSDSGVIPAIADQTIIVWGIMKSVGDTLTYINEAGKEIKLRLIAGLSSSIFQGNLIIADHHFTENFPSSGGSKITLVDTPNSKANEVKRTLQKMLTDYGVEITSTSHRLAEFNTVQNTYLTIFMILGALGLIIGTFGLSTVIVRNLMERRQEIALLHAIGYTKQRVTNLILSENMIVLSISLIIGVGGVVIGILPSLLSTTFDVPYSFILILMSIIILNSIVCIYIPIRLQLKNIQVQTLRKE